MSGQRRGARPGSDPRKRANVLGKLRKKRPKSVARKLIEAARPAATPDSKRFRVLVAVRRPRYRARTERAMLGFDWEVRSLLNKEDPVGMIQRKAPHVFIISDDFGRQKDLGILRAVQRFRNSGMKIIAVFEDAESAVEHQDKCDSSFAPPWKTVDMRGKLAEAYAMITGTSPTSDAVMAEEETHEPD